MKKLMLAVAMVALVAAPSFAAVQNVKVGGDIVTTSAIRSGFDLGSSLPDSQRINEVLAQTRVNVSADLTDNVSTMVTLQNENLWGTNSTYNSNVVLSTAYVTMKEFLYAPLTLTVGRQPLAYGNKLIIGNSGYGAYDGIVSDLTYATGFDAIKAVLAYEPLTIDIFASRIANGVDAGFSNNTHNNTNLFGVNANYKLGDKMSTVVEAYAFANVNDNTTNSTSRATYVPGLRVSTNPIEGLNVQLEGAYQLGRVAGGGVSTINDNRNAFAIQGGLNYALPVMKDLKPVLGAQYTYLSGLSRADVLAGGANGKQWNPLYQDQNAGRIFYALGFDSGVQRLALSATVNPMKDVTAAASLTPVWDVTKSGNNNSRYEGSEADLDVTYAYTEDVKFGVSAGYWMTGKAANQGTQNASQLLSSVSVLF